MNRLDAGTWSPPLSVWGGRLCGGLRAPPHGTACCHPPLRGGPIKGKTLRGSLKAARQPGFPTKQSTQQHLAAASWKHEQVPKRNPDMICVKVSQGLLSILPTCYYQMRLRKKFGWGGNPAAGYRYIDIKRHTDDMYG